MRKTEKAQGKRKEKEKGMYRTKVAKNGGLVCCGEQVPWVGFWVFPLG